PAATSPRDESCWQFRSCPLDRLRHRSQPLHHCHFPPCNPVLPILPGLPCPELLSVLHGCCSSFGAKSPVDLPVCPRPLLPMARGCALLWDQLIRHRVPCEELVRTGISLIAMLAESSIRNGVDNQTANKLDGRATNCCLDSAVPCSASSKQATIGL